MILELILNFKLIYEPNRVKNTFNVLYVRVESFEDNLY